MIYLSIYIYLSISVIFMMFKSKYNSFYDMTKGMDAILFPYFILLLMVSISPIYILTSFLTITKKEKDDLPILLKCLIWPIYIFDNNFFKKIFQKKKNKKILMKEYDKKIESLGDKLIEYKNYR